MAQLVMRQEERDGEMELTDRAIAFLTVSVIKGDGTALGYFLFMPKILTLCLILVINSRVRLNEQLASPAGGFVSRESPGDPYLDIYVGTSHG